MADLKKGFHQVLLSERLQKIMTLVTPFGTFDHLRLVMGFIDASAEFQRHVNSTLRGTLWVECLAMADDLVVANETAEAHRASMLRVFTRLAWRQHSIKPSKLDILQADTQKLGT